MAKALPVFDWFDCELVGAIQVKLLLQISLTYHLAIRKSLVSRVHLIEKMSSEAGLTAPAGGRRSFEQFDPKAAAIAAFGFDADGSFHKDAQPCYHDA